MRSVIIGYNRIIDILKYPTVVVLLASIPFIVPKFFEIIQIMIHQKEKYYFILIGMSFYLLMWKTFFHNIANGWLATFEHELTHAIFALATFHKITAFKATRNNGGHVVYSGVSGGNWLITIAPYFFPTFSVVILIIMYWIPIQFYNTLLGIFGFSLAYHLHSTWSETHYKQTDLKEVGFTFAWLFLPTANILAGILLLSSVPHDNIYLKVVIDKYCDYCIFLIDKIL